jgi:hypothetical protein
VWEITVGDGTQQAPRYEYVFPLDRDRQRDAHLDTFDQCIDALRRFITAR